MSTAFPTPAELGAGLLRLRSAFGLTQDDLAGRSGVSQAEISRIESGRVNPTLETLNALCRELGVPTWMLVGGFASLWGRAR